MRTLIGAVWGCLALVVLWPVVSVASVPDGLIPEWDAYRRASETRTSAEIIAAADALPGAAKRAGIDHAPEMSVLLLRDAYGLRERGDPTTAAEIARIAQALSPSLAEPHLVLSRLLWFGPPGDPAGALREWAAAWYASFSGFWSSLYRAERLVAAVVLSLFSAVALTLLVLALGTIPLIAHLFEEWSGRRLFRITTWSMATVLLMLPLAVGVWGAWLLLLAVAVLWWFLSSRERLLLGMLAVGGLIVSLLLPRVFGFLASDGDPALRLVIDVASGRANASALARVQLADETSDTVAARALGMLRAGQPDDAETLYQEALARWAADPRLLSDYGSLHFHRQDYARAVELYEAASSQAPDSVAVLYNLSQAYRADLRFEEGEARYQAARAIDPGLLDTYAERGRMGDAFLVVDYGFHPKELWTMALAPRALPAFLAGSVERLRRHLSPWVTIGIAALIVVCWLFSRVTPNPAAVSCTTCGTAVCRRCQRYFLDIKLCSSCWKAYAKGITLRPNTPLPQVRQRWIVRRRVAVVLSVIPGVGHLVLGRPFWGFSFAFLGSWLAWMGWLSFSSWNTLGERLFASPWYIVWAPVFVAWLALYAMIAVKLLDAESPALVSIGTGRQDTARGR